MREDWIEATLGEVFETVTGNTPSKKEKDNYGSEIPFIKPPQIDNNFLKNSSEFLSAKGKIKARILPKNSVLVTCIGNLGRIGINKTEVAFNQQINAIKPISGIESKYTFYQAQSVSFRNQLEKLSTSTTVALVNKTSFNSVKFKIAPLPIQQEIVKKIEELFSSLDSGISDLKKAQGQLKIYRQAVLKKAFEGELTKEWREKQTNLPFADVLLKQIKEERQNHFEQQLDDWKVIVKSWEKNGKIGKKPSKPQKPTNLDPKITILDAVASTLDVSNTWNIQPLAFISDNKPNCIVDGPFGSSINVAEDYKEAGVPVIRMVNIRPFKYVSQNLKFIVKEKFNQLKRHNILSKDILIAKVGATIGDCCIYPDNQPEGMLSTTGSCRVRLDSKIYLPELLQYYIFYQKYKLKSIASQTAQPFLNMKVLKAYPIPFLPLLEQHQLIREIESRLSVCDKVEESIKDSLQKAIALRHSILKKAFEGKLLSEVEIVKCKQHNEYEPASVLLEKIKEEKKQK